MTRKRPDFGGHYRLDENNIPVPCSMKEWALSFEHRQLAETFTERCRVSTIFLGLDHQFGNGPPLVFETMVFERESHDMQIGGDILAVHEDLEQSRYSSFDDAMTGHAAAVSRILRIEAAAQVIGAWDKVKKEWLDD